MKTLLTLILLAVPLWPQFTSSNAKRIQGKNVVSPLTCADGEGIVWVDANNRFECGTVGGGGGSGTPNASNTFSAGATTVTVTDNMGTTAKVVNCYIGTAPDYVLLVPNTVQLNSNTVVIGFDAASGDGKCVVNGTGAVAGATVALDNLASVSINAALIPQSAKDLGAQATPWKDLWLYGGGTFGTHSFRLTGTPTGHRVITLPDATATLISGIGGQNNAGSDVGSLYTKVRYQNGTGTTWTLTDLGSGILGAAPNVDTTSLVTLSGTQTMTSKTFGDQVLQTCIAAPSTPSAGLGTTYCDSTSKNWAIKDDAGTVKHGVQTTTATANQFLTAVTAAGVFAKAQPAFTDISGAATLAQLPSGVKKGRIGGYFNNPLVNDVVYAGNTGVACTIGTTVIRVTGSATATVKFWKIAAGTALPTVANVINTSGLAISSGNIATISSTSDFTSTSVLADDEFAITITAISGSPAALHVNTECNQ